MADDDMRLAIGDMIDYSANGDFNKANNIFNDLIAGRVQTALDQEKIAIANSVYNGGEEEDQLDLPLEDDEEYSDEELDAAAQDATEEENEEVETSEDEDESEEN